MIQKIKNNAFARNSLILFAGSMIVNVLNYVFHLALGRMVSVEVYGEIESLLSLTAIISVPSVAIGMIATKFSAGYKADENTKDNYRFFQYLNKKVFIWGFPAFLALVIFTSYIRDFLKISSSWPLILLWLIMFLSFFLAISGGVLTGWQKFKQVNWMNISGAFFKLVLAILLIFAGYSLNGAIGGYLLGVIVSFFVSLLFLKYILSNKKSMGDSKSEKIDFSSVKKYILPAFIGTLAINILGNTDMVLAKHNLDALSAGQYGALTIVSRIIFFVTNIIATVLFSMSSENSHKKTDSSVILKNAIYLMLFVSVVSIIMYFIIPTFIMSMLFGHKYDNVSHYLGWFAVTAVLFSFVNLLFQYLMSIHKTRVAYFLLAISLAAIFSIFFLGTDILAIITIVGIMQMLAIISCLYYLLSTRPNSNMLL